MSFAVLEGNAARADLLPYVAYSAPTDRYDHGVLGDKIEYGALEVRLTSRGSITDPIIARIDLPQDRVFEDLKPRLVDLAGDGLRHVVVVEAQRDKGASLAVYSIDGGFYAPEATLKKIATTPPIGRRYRWLAPAGIADFDGDGLNDIAYVETPHLGKTLKIVTLKGDRLIPIAAPQSGFSNHRIGEDFITSGIRTCAGRVELLTPNADWSALMAISVIQGQITSRQTRFKPTREGVKIAQHCENNLD